MSVTKILGYPPLLVLFSHILTESPFFTWAYGQANESRQYHPVFLGRYGDVTNFRTERYSKKWLEKRSSFALQGKSYCCVFYLSPTGWGGWSWSSRLGPWTGRLPWPTVEQQGRRSPVPDDYGATMPVMDYISWFLCEREMTFCLI